MIVMGPTMVVLNTTVLDEGGYRTRNCDSASGNGVSELNNGVPNILLGPQILSKVWH